MINSFSCRTSWNLPRGAKDALCLANFHKIALQVAMNMSLEDSFKFFLQLATQVEMYVQSNTQQLVTQRCEQLRIVLLFLQLATQHFMPANFFWAKGVRFFSCRVPEFPKLIRLLPKISGKFRGSSEEFRSFMMLLESTKKEQSCRLFSFKIGEPEIKTWFTLTSSSQIGSSSHFSVVNWSFKATSSRLWVRREKLVCRRDLAWDQSFKARLHERKKWNGSDKKWNSSDKFLRVNDTWPVPVLPVPFKKGSIGAYGPLSERNA